MMWLPTLSHILRLHSKLTHHSGGMDGIRDIGLIESALLRTTASYDGQELYTNTEAKAAAVCCGLIGNHGSVDGNKRVGIASMLLILAQNEVVITYTQEEFVALGLSIAQGQMDVSNVAIWIAAHSNAL